MVEIRGLKPEELESWFDHCMWVFNKGEYSRDYRQYFQNHWYNDPWRDMDSILVAVEDGKILSTVRVFYRDVYLKGQKISMGGIGEVSTKPEARGGGFSTKLLTKAIATMEERKVNVSFLGTGIQAFYQRLGWEDNARHFKTVSISSDKLEGKKLRPLDFDRDYPVIKEIHAVYSRRFNGVVVRDEAFYWKNWVKTECKDGWVLEDETGKALAYAFTSKNEQDIYIREFGAHPGYESIFEGMLAEIISRLGKDQALVRMPSAIETSAQVQETQEQMGWMTRLITPFELEGTEIDSTEKLIEALNGENGDNYLFWSVDGF